MSDCLFCKIRDGQIPSTKVYEDDQVFAILDINPVNPGHTLVITKEHFDDTASTPDELICHVASVSRRLAKVIINVLDYPAFNIEANNGAVAGQVIMHTHWHIVPRSADDGLKHWPGKPYAEGEADEVANKIMNAEL